MIVVDRPEMAPGHCIINFSSEDHGGFIDTLTSPPVLDPRVYVSRQAVIDMGRLFGFPTPEEYEGLVESVERMTKEIDALKADNVELTRDVEAAEWTLERKFQAKPQAKPGRKPKSAAAVG